MYKALFSLLALSLSLSSYMAREEITSDRFFITLAYCRQPDEILSLIYGGESEKEKGKGKR